jgi:hypothetical protein
MRHLDSPWQLPFRKRASTQIAALPCGSFAWVSIKVKNKVKKDSPRVWSTWKHLPVLRDDSVTIDIERVTCMGCLLVYDDWIAQYEQYTHRFD